MQERIVKSAILIACCVAVFWPGTLVFGFPGVMGHYWQTTLSVERTEVGRILFFVLAAVGIFMFIIGRLQIRDALFSDQAALLNPRGSAQESGTRGFKPHARRA